MQKTTKFIVYAAVFVAISAIFKLFLGIPVTILGSYLKDINLSPVIIMTSGIVLGPLGGGIVGALTDIVAALIRPMGAYIPLFTLTNALIGIIPTLFFIKQKIELSLLKAFILTFVVQLVCSGVLNTLWLVLLGFVPPDFAILSVRLISALILWPIYAVLLFLAIKYTKKVFIKAFPIRF